MTTSCEPLIASDNVVVIDISIQSCIYIDMDELDSHAQHVQGCCTCSDHVTQRDKIAQALVSL